MRVLAWVVLLGALLAAVPVARAETDVAAVVPAVEREIRERMKRNGIPSVTVAIVSADGVVWTGAYGHSNLATQTPATPQTVYLTCSIWKPVTATALLRAMAEKGVGLDDPVNAHLGDAPVKPFAPDAKPITFRHLLTHTSGIPGSADVVPAWGRTLPTPLGVLTARLAATAPPERAVVYSNAAFALAGRLVERLSGASYDDYVQEHVLGPLGMTSTTFLPTPRTLERMAIPYVRAKGGVEPGAYLRVGEYPAGEVWSTVGDYGRFLAAHLNGGALRNARLLEEAAVDETHRRQFFREKGDEGFGLGWFVRERGGRREILHTGGLPGWGTFVQGDLDAKVGIVLFANLMEAGGPLAKVADVALRLLRGEKYEPFDPAAARRDPVPKEWADYVGTYRANAGPARVRIDGATLVLEAAGADHVLLPKDDGSFAAYGELLPDGTPVRFERGPKGEVTGLRGTDGELRPRLRGDALTAMDTTAPPEGEFAGDWEGFVRLPTGRLGFGFHVARSDGRLTATIDIPAQSVRTAALEHVLHHGKIVHAELDVPGARAVFEGTLEGDRIRGALEQGGGRFPLVAWRAGTPPPGEVKPPAAYGAWIGRWEGTVDLGPARVAFALTVAAEDRATLSIPEQALLDGALEAVSRTDAAVHFELPNPLGRAVFDGTIDGDSMTGTLAQAGGTYRFSAKRAR